MRRRLYLMRHAEVSYVGPRDPEAVRLTERGLEQAAAARRTLDAVAFDLIVAARCRGRSRARRSSPPAPRSSGGQTSSSGAAAG